MTREPPSLPPEFVEFLNRITAKRPRTVIQHILKYGYITTEELAELYGYNHPPRAARDVREQGVPLITFRVTGQDGRNIGAYKFGDPSQVRRDRLGGRKIVPTSYKRDLIAASGGVCSICLEPFDMRHLQVDHRIPYEIAGEAAGDLGDYMLVCGSCNRAKSWSCEHCPNWIGERLGRVCETCYWASPEIYEHIATQAVRRVDVTWVGDEAAVFDGLREKAAENNETLQDYIKLVLFNHWQQIKKP